MPAHVRSAVGGVDWVHDALLAVPQVRVLAGPTRSVHRGHAGARRFAFGCARNGGCAALPFGHGYGARCPGRCRGRAAAPALSAGTARHGRLPLRAGDGSRRHSIVPLANIAGALVLGAGHAAACLAPEDSALPPANLVAVRLTVALGGLNRVDGLTALPLPPRSGE